MKFSTQLVVSILGITILAQAVFGGIAYWIIDDENDHHELLLHLADDIKNHWSKNKEDTLTQATLEKIHHDLAMPDIFILAKNNNSHIYTGSTDNVSTLVKATDQLDIKTKTQGALLTDNLDYHWLATELPNSQYRLIILKSSDGIRHQTSSRLGIRLLATSIIIIWLAVWLALLLSAIISRRLEEKNDALKYQASHDGLTGLANRDLLFSRLEQAQLTSNRNKAPFALLLMDLDNFKEINDALGHHFGDLMLKKIAEKIRETVGDKGSIARLGGDEFAVLLPDATQESAIECARTILNSLKTSFNVRDIRIEGSASIGIALYPQDGSDTEILLQRADIAMYQAKQTRNHFVVYDQSKDSNNVRQLTLMGDLKEAIKNDQLNTYYQPMVDQKTGHTIAVEALARWQHPEFGFISPEEFIPIAERTGVIRKLTLSIARQAIRDCKHWQNMGYDLMVAINISTHCLQDQSFPKKLNQILLNTGLAANKVELEITETAIMQDLGRARQVLLQFDQMGFSLSIDDFGTGFSSLAYLKELPVDTLKIDKSFVFSMDENEDDAVIVQTIIELAHNFNCKTIAEGVENKQSLNQLKLLGNDIAQGFLFSQPRPFEDINQWLQDSEWKPAMTTKESLAEIN